MKTKNWVLLPLKAVLLVVLYAVCFILPASLFKFDSPQLVTAPAGQESQTGLWLGVFLVINLFILIYVIMESPWRGFRLIMGLFIASFGLQTFMTQVETLIFKSAFPTLSQHDVGILFLRGFVEKALFIPFAVWFLGKANPFRPIAADQSESWKRYLGQRLKPVAILSAVYVFLYFACGYFIAWQYPEVRQFYSGNTQLTGLWDNLTIQLRENPGLFVLQYLRGGLWIVFALPLMMMFRGRKTTLLVTLVLMMAVMVVSSLILPNPLMPPTVRRAHLIEVMTSNVIYALLIGWWMYLPISQKEEQLLPTSK